MSRIFTVITVLLFAAHATAQTTRVEMIAGQQAEKAKQLGPEGPSEAERIIRRVLLSPLLNGGDGFYPWFGSVYAGSGMGVGAGFLKRLPKGARFNLQSGMSINSSKLLRGTFASPELWHGMLQVEATAQWLDVRGVSFYGFGQDSRRDAREQFKYSPTEIGGNVTIKPVRHISLTGSYTFLDFATTRDAPLFDADDAPGLGEDLSYQITRGTIMYDWRPATGYSTRGGFYRASFERNFESAGHPYSFNLQEYEIVQQLPILREQFVLAGRALMTVTEVDNGEAVPVMLAPTLGSGSALRGFSNRRFADRNRWLLTGEYRWRPSRYLDMAIFMDAGQVAADRRAFDRSRFEVAWGLGARFHGPAFNALRIEVARGREGTRIIFSGSQPF